MQKTKILNERETDTGSRPTTMLRRKEERKESKKEDEVGNGIKKDPVRSAGTEAPGSSASREIPHFGQEHGPCLTDWCSSNTPHGTAHMT